MYYVYILYYRMNIFFKFSYSQQTIYQSTLQCSRQIKLSLINISTAHSMKDKISKFFYSGRAISVILNLILTWIIVIGVYSGYVLMESRHRFVEPQTVLRHRRSPIHHTFSIGTINAFHIEDQYRWHSIAMKQYNYKALIDPLELQKTYIEVHYSQFQLKYQLDRYFIRDYQMEITMILCIIATVLAIEIRRALLRVEEIKKKEISKSMQQGDIICQRSLILGVKLMAAGILVCMISAFYIGHSYSFKASPPEFQEAYNHSLTLFTTLNYKTIINPYVSYDYFITPELNPVSKVINFLAISGYEKGILYQQSMIQAYQKGMPTSDSNCAALQIQRWKNNTNVNDPIKLPEYFKKNCIPFNQLQRFQWKGKETLQNLDQIGKSSLYSKYKEQIDFLSKLQERYHCSGWSKPMNVTLFTPIAYQTAYTCQQILANRITLQFQFIIVSCLSLSALVFIVLVFWMKRKE